MLALSMSYMAGYVKPDVWIIPAFFGLAYQYLFLLNILFVFFWLIFRIKYSLISLVILLSGWNIAGRHLQIGNIEDPKNNSATFKVLTYNVQNNPSYSSDELNEKQKKLFDYLTSEDADIVCLQEFFSTGINYYYPLIYLKRLLGAKNYYFESYFNPYKQKIVGLAILSKFKRVNNGILPYSGGRNFGIFSDLIFQKDTFRIYNIHLESIYLKNQDYSVIGSHSQSQNDDISLRNSSIRIIKKLKQAFIRRSKQTDNLLAHIKQSPYPVLICGDFNDLPTSYTYSRLTENFMDSFVASGSGTEKTFNSSLPFFRIDYILYDSYFQSFNHQSKNLILSDHKPVCSHFYVKQ